MCAPESTAPACKRPCRRRPEMPGRGAELALELAVGAGVLNARSLAAVGATSRAFYDLILGPAAHEDLWAAALTLEAGSELSGGAARVLAELGGVSTRALAASASHPPSALRTDEPCGAPPPLRICFDAATMASDTYLRAACVAAVEWLLWGASGRLLWSVPSARLLCRRLGEPAAARTPSTPGATRSSWAGQFCVTGNAARELPSLEAAAGVVQEAILADCWAVQISHPSCPATAARWAHLNYDCVTDGEEGEERCREALATTEGIVHAMLGDGCCVDLNMLCGGKAGEGVRYQYSPAPDGSWTEAAVFNYRTNAHGLLATLWQESRSDQDHRDAPFVAPSKWEGWPWSLITAV